MSKSTTKTAQIWTAPILPTIPTSIGNSALNYSNLSNRVKGEWLFYPFTISGIPSPYCDNQDYDFGQLQSSLWEEVMAPCSLIMQGYNIENNNEYYYKRLIIIPSGYEGNRSFIRFEGVYCNARIWVNGHYITTHIGGFTAWDVEVSDYVENGKITLIVGIADIEGKTKGIWNPNGIAMSDASWASYYAHHNICGILRDVTLYFLPCNHIISAHIKPTLYNNYQDGRLDIEILIEGTEDMEIDISLSGFGDNIENNRRLTQADLINSDNITQEYALEQSKEFIKNYAPTTVSDIEFSQRYVGHKQYKIVEKIFKLAVKIDIENPKLWTAESPNLYSLDITLLKGGKTQHVNNYMVGIRQIDYMGENSTDKNKLYINGKEIKLRGVCRHDVSHLYGRSITKEDAYQEILTYKRNNINHIRTSHYPGSRYLIEACDRLGIYVEQENSVCFKGGNGYKVLCAPQQIVVNMSEMTEYNYNSPSIIIWSIGNESGFETTYGFRLAHCFIKEFDPSRPVIFSYPLTAKSKPSPYDIFSKHYAKVDAKLGRTDMPKLHDEFAHIACYNIHDIICDNNYRLAWGESIVKGWKNIFQTDGALGCAIWGGMDDVFYIPQSTHSSHQRHTDGLAIGFGEWGAILDAFKRQKPEAYLTKKAFSPVLMTNIRQLASGELELNILNRFDHTNLSQLKMLILDGDNKIIFDGRLNVDIAPHKSSRVKLDKVPETAHKIQLFQSDYMVEEEAFNPQVSVESISLNEYKLIDKNHIKFGNKLITIDNENAVLIISQNGQRLAVGPYLYVKGFNLKSKHRKIVKADINALTATIIIKEKLDAMISAKYTIAISNDCLEINTKILPKFVLGVVINDYGNYFDIDENVISVSWDKKCLFSSYPAGHLERNKGRAMRKSDSSVAYGEIPKGEWKDDNYNYFLIDSIEKNWERNTNDFNTNRTQINSYTVEYDNSVGIAVDKSRYNINCLTKIEKLHQIIKYDFEGLTFGKGWKIRYKNNKKSHFYSDLHNSALYLEFEGEGIKIIGTRSKKQGNMGLYIDDQHYQTVNTRSDICQSLTFMTLATISGLSRGRHKLTIVILDQKGAKISGFEVLDTDITKKSSKLIVSNGQYYKSLGWGNYLGKRLKLSDNKLGYRLK